MPINYFVLNSSENSDTKGADPTDNSSWDYASHLCTAAGCITRDVQFSAEFTEAEVTDIPEPSTLGMFGLALLGLGRLVRRKSTA